MTPFMKAGCHATLFFKPPKLSQMVYFHFVWGIQGQHEDETEPGVPATFPGHDNKSSERLEMSQGFDG